MFKEKTFEMGPIRPPNEARSLLIRVSRNCPWNRCLFCPVYKYDKFSRRSLDEIKKDIDTIAYIVDELKEISLNQGYSGSINREVLNYVHEQGNQEYFMIARWLSSNEKSVFLQDADNMVYPADFLITLISYLKEKLPECGRITTYARSKSIVKKTTGELTKINEVGLTRLHIGLESGSAHVLEYMKKGVTPEEHIEAGKMVKEAGLLLSEYVILGLGGKEYWQEHAMDTATVLSKIEPHFIRFRSLAVHPIAPLIKEQETGSFTPLDDEDIVKEEKMMIENLQIKDCELFSDHILNLLEDVKGRLPEDKRNMLDVLDEFLSMPPDERDLFRLGRRAGIYRHLNDRNDVYLMGQVSSLYQEIRNRGFTVDEFINDLKGRYL